MMKDSNRNVQEILAATAPQHESKLHGVFHKLSDIWQPQQQKMSATEVLDPAIGEQRFSTPEGTDEFAWLYANVGWMDVLNGEVLAYSVCELNKMPVATYAEAMHLKVDSGGVQAGWRALARRLERELRAAKSAHRLAAGEVLLPADLLPRVAREALRLSDPEPCGLRGCTLHVNLETGDTCRRVSTIKLDSDTVSTFELYLTLRQDLSSWHSLLPQFLKNLTRGSTVVISPRFSLDKKKLYRSYLE
ncbi:Uncharacterized protein GBIM_08615 [Gryllus bimaculatus]|nr:Uncharacterized protein GBIM_08615 [Gryllus bimaculatus]